MVHQGVEGGAGGAAGVENVVTQDDVHVVHLGAEFPRANLRLGADDGEIVAVEGDVERAHRHRPSLDALDDLCDPLPQRNAAAPYAHQHQVGNPVVFLDDFVGEADEGAVNL